MQRLAVESQANKDQIEGLYKENESLVQKNYLEKYTFIYSARGSDWLGLFEKDCFPKQFPEIKSAVLVKRLFTKQSVSSTISGINQIPT